MGRFEADATVLIDGPIDTVYAIAADIEGGPSWRPERLTAECLERGPGGEQVLVRTATESQGRAVKATLRYSFTEPRSISWRQTTGDLPDTRGSWTFEPVGERTRATYAISVDFGRILGRVIRGAVADRLRSRVVDEVAAGLKRRVEA